MKSVHMGKKNKVTLPLTRPEDAFTAKPTFAGIMLLVYVWWHVTTPQYRFDFFFSFPFEKLLFLGLVIGTFIQTNKAKLGVIGGLFILIYFFEVSSYLLSDYRSTEHAQVWLREYWKQILLLVFIALSLSGTQKISFFLIGICLIGAFYQLHSLKDFLGGGSYVYQQGIKRMIGVWAPNGYGSGPAWGFLSAAAVPFGVFAYRYWSNCKFKYAALAMITLSIICLVNSGSRGALLTLVAWALFFFRSYLYKPKFIFAGLIIAALGMLFMPDALKERYFSSFTADKGDIAQSDKIAAASAASRLDGLLDGIAMANNKPVFGYGPGVSAIARAEVSDKHVGLQMHSLYGQILGEIGYIGFLLFLILWLKSFKSVNIKELAPSISAPELKQIKDIKECLQGQLVILLVYGFSGHTLYHYRWLWLFGVAAAFISICKKPRR